MTIEQRVDALERRVTRYRSATWTLALVLVAGVVMGQAPKDAEFESIICRDIAVMSEDDRVGVLIVGNNRHLVGHSDTGGFIGLYSNDRYMEAITLKVDESGNGVVGVWDRKGEGRTLTPGP